MKNLPTHDDLWARCRLLPQDYWPYGLNLDREGRGGPYRGDCSCGCRWYYHLHADWGVCLSPYSHRAGLLTFEHQAGPCFASDPEAEAARDVALDALLEGGVPDA